MIGRTFAVVAIAEELAAVQVEGCESWLQQDDVKVRGAFTGKVRQWPTIRIPVAQHAPRAEALAVEDKDVLSFAERRRMIAVQLHINGLFVMTPPRATPREFLLLDTNMHSIVADMIAPGEITEGRLPCAASTTRTLAPSTNLQVHVERLGGTPLSYIASLEETCKDLKLRIAEDLAVPHAMVTLLIRGSSFELSNDVPLSAYCLPHDATVRCMLVVSLRDVYAVASHGDSDEMAGDALRILMEKAAPDDDLAIKAAHECLSNIDWDSPLMMPTLKLLRNVLPLKIACPFFGACIACGPSLVRAYGADVLHQMQKELGRDFVESCLTACDEKRWRGKDIFNYLQTF
jgi:hypothetical protein